MLANIHYWNKTRSWLIILVCATVIAMLLGGCSNSQQTKVYKVGVLSGLNFFAPAVDGFKAKMAELGYVEGKNITYDVQLTDVDMEAYQRITKKFVDDKVDLIFAFPTEAAMVAKTATQGTDIPVIFALAFTDIPDVKLIDSIRQPGGNITGVRFPSAEIAGKRLQILLELAPNAKRVFVPFLKDYPNIPGQLEVIRSQAGVRGVELIEFPAATPEDLQAELDRRAAADDIGFDAILTLADPLAATPSFYSVYGKFSYEHKLPIGGTLMDPDGYGNIFGLTPLGKVSGELAAPFADKIFRGMAAGTIPVSTAEGYFQINYKAAQALGVTVPEGLLKQADEVIR